MALYKSENWSLTGSKTVQIDHKLAEEFANMPGSPTERDLKPGRVNKLRAKIEAGEAVTFGWATAKISGQSKVFRVNGYHSSTMLAGLNGSMPEGLTAHLDEYEVPTHQGLGLLFRQFDSSVSARSRADVAGAYQGLVDDLDTVPKSYAKLGIEGVSFYRNEVIGLPKVIGDDRYELLNEPAYHPFLKWTPDVWTEKTKELQTIPVAAAMFGTFEEDGEAAEEFWVLVGKGGEGFDEDAPAHVLDQWLRDIKARKWAGLKPGTAQIYQGCVFAWNAWRGDKKIRAIKSDTSKGFLDIA